ncbi:MAG: type 4a pilus biogenesis protein PilO [Cellvibrionales bacterium]|jgi:type IV pilus assembly protein PilO|nr:type 4a pilus biogenesis protein PilO [Cellvibrionales bacterium]MBK8675349.1 type 4a pilus biogenesis protein PilO [Cellvibrionales bacterium]HRG50634.1 type 4a pilus biogenesis protein PilO [Pseudomonadales bacterium]
MSLQDNLEKIKNDFSNLDPENMGSWPLPVKVVCWVLMAIIVIVLSYQFVLKEQTAVLDQEIQKEQTLRTSFESKVGEAANLEAYRAQMKEMKESFDALVLQLPKDTEVPGLLDDISNTGQSSGLNIESIKLLPEKKADFYVELPIDIQVSGGYHDFATFASGIAGLPRIVTLHDFLIAPVDAKSGASKASSDVRNSEELTMTITAKTYRYGNSSSNDAAKKGKDGGK